MSDNTGRDALGQKERIELDTAGEFASMRRSYINAKSNSIITDARKKDPLRAVKLFRGSSSMSSSLIKPRRSGNSGNGTAPAGTPVSPIKPPSGPSPNVTPITIPHATASPSQPLPTLLPVPRAKTSHEPVTASSVQSGSRLSPAPQSKIVAGASRSASQATSLLPKKANLASPLFPDRPVKLPKLIKIEDSNTTKIPGTGASIIDRKHAALGQSKSPSPPKSWQSSLLKVSPARIKLITTKSIQNVSSIQKPKLTAEPINVTSSEGEDSLSANESVNDADGDDQDEDEFFDASEKIPVPFLATQGSPKRSSPKTSTGTEKSRQAAKTKETTSGASKTSNTQDVENDPKPKETWRAKEFSHVVDARPKISKVFLEKFRTSKGGPSVKHHSSRSHTIDEGKVVVDEDKISGLKVKLRRKLVGKSSVEPYYLDDGISQLESLVFSVVKNRESHSCCVFGPKNSGKSTAFFSALNRVRERLDSNDDFIFINIHGSAQDDDKLAVRAIAEQLDAEISRIYNVDLRDLEVKELLTRKSITNTFSNILKVLSDEVQFGRGDSGKIIHPIVFCIDEADVYADQPRQALLYNLFDLAENSQTPVCIVCFTSRFTFKEMLEKRVRSRFSQRTIQFRKLPLDKFVDVCTRMLCVDDPENDYEEEWNSDIKALFSGDNAIRRSILYNHLSAGNIKAFQNQCLYPLSKVTIDDPLFSEEHFKKYSENQAKASYVDLVNSLSDLELFLLVSAARVIAKRDMSWVNLNITYEEYKSQVKVQQSGVTSSTGFGAVASTGFKLWSKEACKQSWETLRDMSLLTLPGSGEGKNEFVNSTFETKMWQVELTLDELRRIVKTHKPAKTWTRL